MVRDGIYYALGMLLVAAVLWWLAAPAWAAIPLLLAVFFLWFFRDPERVIPSGSGLIVSPADGKVTEVAPTVLDGQPATRISIFLSVFDVHVNRSPASGVIKDVTYRRGKFLNAMDQASAADNEQNIVTMETPGGKVVFKQIAGLLARRIVFNHHSGDTLSRGQRVGLIKFGSRTDVIFTGAVETNVKAGDRVKGGSSILAHVQVATGTEKPGSTARPARESAEALR
ncbi:MAG TPA: phosphatidylserine decarboxylase [Candidatus Angelobacter sp.]|nr:phosphatidylserine decarboxylase [Candidatus Angelobacter sp.]